MEWRKAALVALGWEAAWWAVRRANRAGVYAQAQQVATALQRPLVVVGAPDLGATGGYDCGDIVVDIRPSALANSIVADICQPLPFRDDSVVVFVSCVLEYVADYAAALAELQRISGGYLFVVRVEPWTLTSYFYPGTQRRVPAQAPSPALLAAVPPAARSL